MESLNRLKDIHEKEVLGECRGGRVGGVGLVSTGGSHLDQWPKSRGQARVLPHIASKPRTSPSRPRRK